MALDAGTWPLSRKILGLALLNLILIALVLALFAQWQFGLSVESLVLGPARDRVMGIANAVGRELDLTPDASRTELLAAYSRRYGVDFYLTDPRGQSLAGAAIELPAALLDRMRYHSGPGGKGPGPPGPGFGPRGGPPSEPAFLTITRKPLTYWIGVRMPINGPNGERGVPAVLLLRASSIWNSQLFFDWRALLWLAATLAAVALLCWWPFVHRVTRSIRQMDHATEEIAQGRFDKHVMLRRRDELGHLGRQINRMAGRLEGFVKHQKRFLGDIAHELSAPIARIQFALGILEQKVGDAQRAHVDVLREEIQEMSGLVNELLLFSKAGMRAEEAPLKPVALGAIVQRAVAHHAPGVSPIQVAVAPTLSVIAYEPYLLRAISNLLRNAVRYAGEDGPIAIGARQEGGQVLLTVSDCGPGLPEESLEEVFAPFYRLESARSRDTGGAGLGLAIVKSCIEACHGTVECRNRKPSGLEVTISLPGGNGI